MIGIPNPAIVSASPQPAAEATANGRKALPEVMRGWVPQQFVFCAPIILFLVCLLF